MVLTDTNVKVAVVNSTDTLLVNNAVYYAETKPIDTLGLQAYGNWIFKNTPMEFYNSYTPFRYGDKLSTPQDAGWMYMPFALFPHSHQPSGHLNTSKAREIYLDYTSSYISSSTTCRVIVLADCLNFILSKNGSAVLRFAT